MTTGEKGIKERLKQAAKNDAFFNARQLKLDALTEIERLEAAIAEAALRASFLMDLLNETLDKGVSRDHEGGG